MANTDIRLPGTKEPIARYIYLVNEVSDALRMGGTVENAYTNFQLAYNAADTLQVALGGTNKVAIQVGVTTAASVGNLILTAAWNNNVVLQGLSQISSEVGNIDSSNAAGAGFNIGNTVGTNVFRAYNMKIGNISTNATGATGNSGNFCGTMSNVTIGNINTSITNVANTTGNGGRVNIAALGNAAGVQIGISTITTSSQATTSSAGIVSITASLFNILAIITANNNAGGAVITTSNYFGGGVIGTITVNSTTNAGNINLTNTRVNLINHNIANTVFSVTPYCLLVSCKVSVLNCTNSGVVVFTAQFTDSIIDTYISTSPYVRTLAYRTSFTYCEQIGDDSIFQNCTFTSISGATACITDIGFGCNFQTCSFIGGSFSIESTTGPVVVYYKNTSFEQTVFGGVTLVEDGGVPSIPDAAGLFSFDGVLNSAAVFVLANGSGTNVNTLDFNNLVSNRRYEIIINNTTGVDTVVFTSPMAVTFFIAGGVYVPTATAFSMDKLTIIVDDVLNVFITPTYNFI
jgi:hypothetical protein